MNLKTQYMGIDLPHPLIAGASPLTDSVDNAKQLEDAGIAMICMPSLFEEQIIRDQMQTHFAYEEPAESFAEALTYMPAPEDFRTGLVEFLQKIADIKHAVNVPVAASLNGYSPGGWLRFAKLIEEAGADALELNVYDLPTDPTISGQEIEQRTIKMVEQVCDKVDIPVTVKLSPFYASPAHLAQQLVGAGAEGLVIFNRFYQADIDTEERQAIPYAMLSTSSDLLLRLRWLAILSGQINASLAVTGGVHTSLDVVKSIMCGAHVTQLVSCLLQCGPSHVTNLLKEVTLWLEEHEYESLHQMQGSMNLQRCPDPSAYERANYMQVLQSWTMD